MKSKKPTAGEKRKAAAVKKAARKVLGKLRKKIREQEREAKRESSAVARFALSEGKALEKLKTGVGPLTEKVLKCKTKSLVGMKARAEARLEKARTSVMHHVDEQRALAEKYGLKLPGNAKAESVVTEKQVIAAGTPKVVAVETADAGAVLDVRPLKGRTRKAVAKAKRAKVAKTKAPKAKRAKAAKAPKAKRAKAAKAPKAKRAKAPAAKSGRGRGRPPKYTAETIKAIRKSGNAAEIAKMERSIASRDRYRARTK